MSPFSPFSLFNKLFMKHQKILLFMILSLFGCKKQSGDCQKSIQEMGFHASVYNSNKYNYSIPYQLFIPKKGGLKMEDLIIEGDDHYIVFEKGDDIVVKNNDCCRSIKVTIKTKE
jgi:hypothetical protein